MAVKDVEKYFYKMKKVKYEMQENLIEWDKALQAGYVTEDRVLEAKRQFELVKTDYDRLEFIMFLLKKRNYKDKQPKQYEEQLAEFQAKKADDESVVEECYDALAKTKDELDKINNGD